MSIADCRAKYANPLVNRSGMLFLEFNSTRVAQEVDGHRRGALERLFCCPPMTPEQYRAARAKANLTAKECFALGIFMRENEQAVLAARNGTSRQAVSQALQRALRKIKAASTN